MKSRIETMCLCGKRNVINGLDTEKVIRWLNGELVQNVFPELDSTTHETIISGLCPECQEKFFVEAD